MQNSHLQDTFVDGAQSWVGRDVAAEPSTWTYALDSSLIADLRNAANHAADTGKDIVALAREDFPLTHAQVLIQTMREDLLRGRGFCLVRGLPVAEMDRREVAVVFWGIGAHLGLAVSQNGKGHVLGHVKDLGVEYDDPKSRGYQTAARLPYHTDYADLVGLLCLNVAAKGGASSIVSSVSVYNRMLAERPDLVRALREPLYRTRWGEVGSDRPAWVEVPAFNVHEAGVVTTYVRSAVRKAQLHPDVPRLTSLQNEAMDLFDAIAADEELRLDMEFSRGDMQFVNNHWILHSRTAYEDHAEPERKRHLLRLWLACQDGPPFPPAMTESFQGLTANGRPNGIHVPGVPLIAPLDAA